MSHKVVMWFLFVAILVGDVLFFMASVYLAATSKDEPIWMVIFIVCAFGTGRSLQVTLFELPKPWTLS